MISGCSSFTWETMDGKHLLGRTYDQFGSMEGNRIAVVPRRYKMKTEVGDYSDSVVTVKYAHLGMAVTGLHTPVIVDGINEKGLMGALLNFPEYAVYDTQLSKHNINVHPGFLTGYLLGQCENVEEVVKYLSFVNLTDEKIFGEAMSVHYIFCDCSGESVVIEPEAGGIHIHRDCLGVMTNSPDYLWHKSNLRNYIAITNLHTPPKKIIDIEFSCFGKGTGGGFGLPGDYSSPSRFVRVAMMKNFAVKGKDEIDGISKMFHNFSAVDIPDGILKADPEKDNYEQTLCISGMCAESLTYYFSTVINRRISALCLCREVGNRALKFYDLPRQQDICYLN